MDYSVLVSILLFIGFGLFIYSTIRPIFNKGKVSFKFVCLFVCLSALIILIAFSIKLIFRV